VKKSSNQLGWNLEKFADIPDYLLFSKKKTMYRYLSLFLLLGFLFSCQNQQATEEATADDSPPALFNWQAIADQLLDRMDLQAGEKVLLVGQEGLFDPLVPLLRAGVSEAGAIDLGAINVNGEGPNAWSTAFTQRAASLSLEELHKYLAEVDLGVMLPGAVPTHDPYAALQDILEEGRRRTIHFHWAGAYHLNGAEKTVDTAVHVFYQKVLANTNYEQLAAKQQSFEDAMRGQTIRVTTARGTDISFQIGDRPVTKQDGNASAARAMQGKNLIDREVELPAGAIRVAPIEETVNGTIAFPDGEWNGKVVKGLVMNFEKGKLKSFEASQNKEAVQAVLDKNGESARSFREFALGFNPQLSIEAAGGEWIPYYGYGAGVVRLSLGDNTELGGKVGGGYVRWNFFPEATVTVGEETWVESGRLVGW
jgi:hypothetical protein